MVWLVFGLPAHTALLVVAGVAAVLVLGRVFILFIRRRGSPEERERLRRLELYQRGRTADGMVFDFLDDSLHFSYTVAGTTYQATQDVSKLRARLPEEKRLPLGPCFIRFLAENPANSMVISEDWSGLRTSPQRVTSPINVPEHE